ncbi:MAG: ureC [Pseudonocardiales bacterium]|nr:ureC [Pseudonocardiales bacterium]
MSAWLERSDYARRYGPTTGDRVRLADIMLWVEVESDDTEPGVNLHSLIKGWRSVPMNAAFLARGSSASTSLLEEAAMAGAGGYKVHEDWGAAPIHIDSCLTVAEQVDLPVALHTDTLNETGYLSDTLEALAGRTVHAYQVEGGGGHPDLLQIVSGAECDP